MCDLGFKSCLSRQHSYYVFISNYFYLLNKMSKVNSLYVVKCTNSLVQSCRKVEEQQRQIQVNLLAVLVQIKIKYGNYHNLLKANLQVYSHGKFPKLWEAKRSPT